MFLGPGPALGGEAGRLVEHDRGAVLGDDHAVGEHHLGLAQRLAFGPLALRRRSAGRHPQHLSRDQPVGRIGALAVDPQLTGPRPAADHGEANLRQVALEPAIEPDVVVVGRDGELADPIVLSRVEGAHAATRISARPASSPSTPAATETSA